MTERGLQSGDCSGWKLNHVLRSANRQISTQPILIGLERFLSAPQRFACCFMKRTDEAISIDHHHIHIDEAILHPVGKIRRSRMHEDHCSSLWKLGSSTHADFSGDWLETKFTVELFTKELVCRARQILLCRNVQNIIRAGNGWRFDDRRLDFGRLDLRRLALRMLALGEIGVSRARFWRDRRGWLSPCRGSIRCRCKSARRARRAHRGAYPCSKNQCRTHTHCQSMANFTGLCEM